MGKATIISGGTGGLYTVAVDLDESRLSGMIAYLTAQKAFFDAEIPNLTGRVRDLAEMRAHSLEKEIERLEAYQAGAPPQKTIYCVDYTEIGRTSCRERV